MAIDQIAAITKKYADENYKSLNTTSDVLYQNSSPVALTGVTYLSLKLPTGVTSLYYYDEIHIYYRSHLGDSITFMTADYKTHSTTGMMIFGVHSSVIIRNLFINSETHAEHPLTLQCNPLYKQGSDTIFVQDTSGDGIIPVQVLGVKY